MLVLNLLEKPQRFGKGFMSGKEATWHELIQDENGEDVLWSPGDGIVSAHQTTIATFKTINEYKADWWILTNKFIDPRDPPYHGIGPYFTEGWSVVQSIRTKGVENVMIHFDKTGEDIMGWTLGTLKPFLPHCQWITLLSDVHKIMAYRPVEVTEMDVFARVQRIVNAIEAYHFWLGRVRVKFV